MRRHDSQEEKGDSRQRPIVQQLNEPDNIDRESAAGDSRQRPIVQQLNEPDNIDRESAARPVQSQRKDPFEQPTTHRVPNELLRKQLQSPVPDNNYSHGPQTISDGRRLSATHVPDLPPISESGLFKTTRIAGDNKRTLEVMDGRKFHWEFGKRLTILTYIQATKFARMQKVSLRRAG
jgi:hypothetical protein